MCEAKEKKKKNEKTQGWVLCGHVMSCDVFFFPDLSQKTCSRDCRNGKYICNVLMF